MIAFWIGRPHGVGESYSDVIVRLAKGEGA
jgi:hypothetical protein